MEQFANILYELYSAFVLRDLVYLFLGAVPVLYALHRKFQGLRDFLREHPKLFVCGFLCASYISGIAIYHCAVLAKIIHEHPPCKASELLPEQVCPTAREQQAAFVVALTRIQEVHPGQHAIKYVERIIYLKQMTAAAGVALGIVALIVLLDGLAKGASAWMRIKWLVIVLILTSLSAGSLWTNRESAVVQQIAVQNLLAQPDQNSQEPEPKKKRGGRKRRWSRRW